MEETAMENPNLSNDALVGRIAALEWMVAQQYALILSMSEDPKGFLDDNRKMISERVNDWRLPSEISRQAALEVFDRVFSIAELNSVPQQSPAPERG
jgi:hypothetical protein